MASRKKIQQMTISQWEAAFPDEASCREYLTMHRWPSGEVSCPRCGNKAIYELASGYHWQCEVCAADGYRFSVIAGTIFENTNKPLRDWFRVIHKMLTSKKGISALQIHREMGFGSYKTAWYMCHRVRVGLANEDFRKLMGVVEVDETFIGGDDSNRHIGKKKGSKGKSIVIGAAQRKGNVIARVLDRADHYGMEQFVRMVCGDTQEDFPDGPLAHGNTTMLGPGGKLNTQRVGINATQATGCWNRELEICFRFWFTYTDVFSTESRLTIHEVRLEPNIDPLMVVKEDEWDSVFTIFPYGPNNRAT